MSAVFPDLCKNLDSSFQHCFSQYESFLSSSSSYFRLTFAISAATALPGLWLHLQNKIFTFSRPAWILGESLTEMALPCSEGHWWHTCTDQLSSGELLMQSVMQSVVAGQLVWARVFNLVCSSLGGHLHSQISCYKLHLQWLSKPVIFTFLWLTSNTESWLPDSCTVSIATASQITANG